eukprot:TRINITY_DN7551_c0_g1_i10.p2 TRINITY_DN7551_c0_g1~~TRINITY_DN7551_c0_g1_i10.p2  ORF type:complete len:218 (+),score=-10.65 TRINITY_DN7551_c0_g1_i10:1023-1676(+)
MKLSWIAPRYKQLFLQVLLQNLQKQLFGFCKQNQNLIQILRKTNFVKFTLRSPYCQNRKYKLHKIISVEQVTWKQSVPKTLLIIFLLFTIYNIQIVVNTQNTHSQEQTNFYEQKKIQTQQIQNIIITQKYICVFLRFYCTRIKVKICLFSKKKSLCKLPPQFYLAPSKNMGYLSVITAHMKKHGFILFFRKKLSQLKQGIIYYDPQVASQTTKLHIK